MTTTAGCHTGAPAAAALRMAQELHEAGFDICHPFCPAWYNQCIADEPLLDLQPLPANNASNTSRAFLIGNTRHVWRPFIAWCQQQQQQQQLPANPLDTYCQEQIQAIVSKHYFVPPDHDDTTTGTTPHFFWSNSYRRDTLVSMQRVALVSGLAYWDAEATAQLSLHPVVGPWLSFRAVVVVDVDATTTTTMANSSPPPPPPPLSATTVGLAPDEQQQARKALQHALGLCDSATMVRQQLQVQDPHDAAAAAATTTTNRNDDDDDDTNSSTNETETIVQAWIAVRDCFATGRETHRFGRHQLLYHYTQNKKYLVADDE